MSEVLELKLRLERPSPPKSMPQRMTYREYEEVLRVVAKCAVTMERSELSRVEEMLARWEVT